MSNLLKDASILLTPTAYENGRMNAIKPSKDLYGPELVTNGDFATDSDWSKGTGWSIENGQAICNGVGINSLQQGVATTTGKTYKLTFDVLDSNNFDFLVISTNFGDTYVDANLNNSVVIGRNTFYIQPTNGTGIRFRVANGTTLTIDNVSVKEDLSGDFQFSRNSAATRVNAQGLVENVQILSPELVSNGNFSQIGTEEVSNGNFSQEGSELVTNGDFATDSDWTFTSGWSISDGKLIANNATSIAYQGISAQPNKSYKVTFTVSSYTSGNVKIQFLGGSNSGTPRTSTGTFTEYITLDGSANGNFAFSRTQNFTGSIDNVSVKEVGQDWNLGNKWSIGENSAIRVPNSTSNLSQVISGISGKTIKVSYAVSNYVSGDIGASADGNNYNANNGNGTFVEYITPTSDNFYLRASYSFEGSITNISVKEVGQDWTFGSGWSVDQANSKATFDGGADSNLTSSLTVVNGTKYRYKFDVSDMTAGSLSLRLGAGNVSDLSVTSNGTYEGITTSEGTQLLFRSNSGFNGSISNISVKEITDDTDLPRINYEGFSYQDSLGSELVVNGDFATDSNWVKGAGTTISGGAANLDGSLSSSFADALRQVSLFTVGKTYKVTYTISNYVSGATIIFGNGATEISANGTYTEYITATITNLGFQNRATPITCSIDNVSVKEVLGQEAVPDSGCGSWLLEPQSTNLITYSSDYTQSFWNKLGSPTITANYGLSPDGQNDSTRIQGNSSTVVYANTPYANSNFDRSIYIKATSGSGDIQLLSHNTNTNNVFTINENWQRFDINSLTSGTGDNVFYALDMRGASTDIYDIEIWGAQNEDNISYATSYIPTNGATNTRLQDLANNSGNASLINSTEGVLYAEIAALTDDLSNRMIALSDSNSSDHVRIYYTTSTNNISVAVKSNGSNQYVFLNHNVTDITDYIKIAVKYKANDFATFINGVKVNSQTTTASAPVGLDRLNFDSGAVAHPFYGKCKALAVYKEVLTDANLRCLTYPPAVATTFDLDFDTIAEQFTFTRGSEATFVNEQGLIESTNQIGPELVTNGDFENGSTGWNLSGSNISIANGKGISTGSNFGAQFKQTILQTNKTYKLVFDIVDYTSGAIGLTANYYGEQNVFSSIGTHTAIFTSLNQTELRIYSENFVGSIDNVSVKEVISATNTPRIDYSTGTKAFLLEPQSTNLITYSEDIASNSFSKIGTSIQADATTSPDGTANADLEKEDASNGSHFIYKDLNLSSGQTYAISVFAKKNGTNRNLRFGDGGVGWSSGFNANFDLTNGTSSGGVIEDYGNGWYRCSVVGTTSATTSRLIVYITLNTSTSYQGDGSSGVFLFGFQVENQSYATSYIPTSGASATRNQELCVDATPVINSEEGTLYAEISALVDGGSTRSISLNDGTSNVVVIIRYRSDTNQIQYLIKDGINPDVGNTYTLTDSTNYSKIALKYKNNDITFWVDGSKIFTSTSPISLSNLNNLSFDTNGANPFFGNTKGLKYYPKALADVQLEDLTTI